MAKRTKTRGTRLAVVPSGADGASAAAPRQDGQSDVEKPGLRKIKTKVYEAELARLQIELVKLQEWIRHQGLKVAVIFEGRDAAGKGGTIKRITQSLNPRVCRVVALTAPTEPSAY
jgi:polyphosphate kinase 2 (PPK2 family)